MKKHPTTVENWDGSLEELARAIGRMRYDKVARFIGLLADDLRTQAEGDQRRGRAQLARMLMHCAATLDEAQGDMERIFTLCKPHMHDELSLEGD